MILDNVDDIYPLSPMQRLMLMHSLRTHGSSTLANQFRYRIIGDFDESAFAARWRRMINRNAALRTAFLWDDLKEPVQVVRSQVDVPLTSIDLRNEPEAARTTRLQAIQDEDRSHGFDLRRAPLMRLTLIRLTDDEHILLWSRHHLILDLWSAQRLFAAAFSTNDKRETADDPGQFRDYIEWLGQQDSDLAARFWREYLHGLESPSLLFSDRAARSHWSGSGQPMLQKGIGPDLLRDLESLARHEGVTFGTLVQAVIALLIAARTERDDVVFGLTVSGRPQSLPDVEDTLGSFINNVPVRMRVEPQATVGTWLAEIHRNHAERMPFEYVSPVDIQRWSELPPQKPLYDLLVLFHPPLMDASDSGSLSVRALAGPFDTAFPVTLALEPGQDNLTITAVYDAGNVAESEVAALVNEVETGLARLAANAHGVIGDLLPANLHLGSLPSPGSERLADRPELADADAEPGDVMLGIWRQTLGIDPIGLDDDFFALGGTSIQAAMVFAEIERRLGRDLPLSILFSAGSVRKLLAALDLPASETTSLVSIQPNGSRPPVLVTPGIGGNVVGLSGLARAPGPEQPFYGLQPKGLFGSDGPESTVEEIAEDFIAASETLHAGDYILLGICFGANVVLEMAQRLATNGKPPALLVVVDPVYATEHTDEPGPTTSMLGFVRRRLSRYVRDLRSLDGPARIAWLKSKGLALWQKIRERDLLGDSRFEIRQRRVEAAQLNAAQQYQPQPYGGATRVLVTADRSLDASVDPRQTWVATVAPHAEVEKVRGSDTGDALAEHAAVLADRVRRMIDDVSEHSDDAGCSRSRR